MSINFHTPRNLCTVKYKDLEDAVNLCIKAGKGWQKMTLNQPSGIYQSELVTGAGL